MKKVLLASTALVMTAGVAAADVTLSGYAEIGVFMVDDDDGTRDDLEFHSDFDVTFTLSGETDNGLTFGATIDLDEVGDDDTGGDAIANDGSPGSAVEEHSVFVSGAFGTLTMGDTDGAFDRVMQELGWGTALADDHTTHAGFSGNGGLDGANDGQILRYDYSLGDFAFAASLELDDVDTNDDVFGIGAEYTADLGGASLNIAVGFQDGSVGGVDSDITGISLDLALDSGFEARANFSTGDWDGTDGDDEHIGVGVAYLSGPLVVEANWGENDRNGTTTDGFGLALNYDIGGGAVVMAGYGTDDTTDRLSVGLGLSF
ncbi:MAG: porin [Pseudomonadota bacterium]